MKKGYNRNRWETHKQALLMAFLFLLGSLTISQLVDRLPLDAIVQHAAGISSISGSDTDAGHFVSSDDQPLFQIINDNIPWFEEDGITDLEPGTEIYAELDSLGRCGPALALIGPETLPDEERGYIGAVKPTGWHTVKYKGIDGNYLYNRCHLIAFSLAGENDNERNLITGTRYMNTEGMLPFEMQVLDYVKNTGNHVIYRVTPIFMSKELLAVGVEIEARSVEDDNICFNVFCPNIQPGVEIDYATGESRGPAYE